MKDMKELLGDRLVSVARELTKLFEEIFRGRLSEAIEHFSKNQPRGEFTVVLAGFIPGEDKWTKNQVLQALTEQTKLDVPPAQIAKQVSKLSNWPRRDVYDLYNDTFDWEGIKNES